VAHKKAEYPPRIFKTRLPELVRPSEVVGLAAKVGVTPMTMRRIVRGCDVKMSVARKVARIFGLSVSEVWPG
jgi:plasmid maintenance system antidote protein VapI